MQDNSKYRYTYIDNISGILILDMVFIVHVCPNCNIHNNYTYYIWLLFCYFMPWFFFKSGMFYKPNTIPLSNGIKKLVIPYILFSFFGLILHLAFELYVKATPLSTILINIKEDVIYRGGIDWNLALWFLISLFAVRIITPILNKILPISLILILSVLISWGANYLNLTYPVWIGNIALGIMFYTIGYLLRVIQYNKSIFYISSLLFICGFFLPLVTKFDFRCNQIGVTDNYLVVMLYCTSGIITINNIAFKFFNKPITIITNIGKNSIILYVIHFPIIMLCTSIIKTTTITNPYYIFIIVSISIIITYSLAIYILQQSDKLGFMIGRKTS